MRLVREIGINETFRIEEPLVIDNEPIILVGQGPRSIVRVPFSDKPIATQRISSFYRDCEVRIVNCTIESEGPWSPAVPFFDLQWPRGESIFEDCVTLENVRFRSAGILDGRGFGQAMRMQNVWFVSARNVRFYGDTRLSVVNGQRIPVDPNVVMFDISGRGAGFDFEDVYAQRVDRGVELTGDVQGITATNLVVMDSRVGLYAHATPGLLEPQIALDRCHFNTRERGAVLRGFPQSTITDCLLYHEENSVTDWFGLDIQSGSSGLRVSGSSFVRNVSRERRILSTGMALADAGTEFWGNRAQGIDTLAWITGRDTRVGLNTLDGAGGVQDNGVGTVWVSEEVKRRLLKVA